jgi:hypothetical protein
VYGTVTEEDKKLNVRFAAIHLHRRLHANHSCGGGQTINIALFLKNDPNLWNCGD